MREIAVFSAVGLTATLTHYFVALLLVGYAGVTVLWANAVAYCCAVGVSYFGHSVLTFQVAMTKGRAVKFVVVSVSALGLSQLLLAALTAVAWFNYKINMLFVVGVIPGITYLMSKFWVYRRVN